jgi:hypothetical protein
MDDTVAADMDAFVRMARESPVRTGVFTFSLPVFAILQLVNGLVHGGSLLFIAGFVVLALASSGLLAQYQLAVYRQRRLSRELL